MSNRLKCCCGDSGCLCNSFSFDFEVMKQAGTGGTARAQQLKSNICNMLDDIDDDGTSINRIVGSVTFTCTSLNGWVFDTGTAQYDPNIDYGGAVGYRWERPPTYTLGRCTDVGCQTCDSERVLSWVITNDTTGVTAGTVSTYTSLPAVMTGCFPSLPSTPTNGLYRIVWLTLYASADRALREFIDNTPYNGGSCPADSDTTGSASAISPFYLYVGFIWDTTDICTEGTLVGTFEWDGLKFGCDLAYPYDNDACSSSTTTFTCTPGPSAVCCSGTTGVPEDTYDYVQNACFFDFRDADADNWSTT